MKKIFIALTIAGALLTACNEEETNIETNDDVEQIHEVEVEILTPEAVAVNESIKLEVKVTQGGEVVNDADDVTFEVWESGKREEGNEIKGEFLGEGIFSAEMTFDHDGVYYMFAHTNARGLHVMPKQKITVGNPDMSTVLPDESSNSMNHSDQSSTHSDDEEQHEEGEKQSH